MTPQPLTPMSPKRIHQVPFSAHFGSAPQDEYQALLLLLYHLTSAGRVARDLEAMGLAEKLSEIGALGPSYQEWLSEATRHIQEITRPSGSLTAQLGNLSQLLLEILTGDRDPLPDPE